MWYLKFSKRLLHRLSFIIILCLIPIIVAISNNAMQGESGVLKILLYCEDNDKVSKNAVNSLLETDSIIRFEEFNSLENAVGEVSSHKADAVWVFKNNLERRIDKFMSGKTHEPFIEVLEREDSTPLQLSREVLYGSIFDTVSYSLCKNYSYKNVITETDIAESKFRHYYENRIRNDKIVVIKQLDSKDEVKEKNYLTVPVRGLLSLILVLTVLAASMYFLKDQEEGKYDWLPSYKRILPAFALCLSSATFTGLAIFIGLLFSDNTVGFFRELILMVLFIFATTGFGLVFCIVFKSYGKLGAAIPGILVSMLALSPIFFNLSVLRPLRLFIPTYYYLNAAHNTKYYMLMIYYCIFIYCVSFILNYLFSRKEKRNAII